MSLGVLTRHPRKSKTFRRRSTQKGPGHGFARMGTDFKLLLFSGLATCPGVPWTGRSLLPLRPRRLSDSFTHTTSVSFNMASCHPGDLLYVALDRFDNSGAPPIYVFGLQIQYGKK
jgi:hypothetical protein